MRGRNRRSCAATSRPTARCSSGTAASEHLLHHAGRALVFDDRDELLARIDDPDLDVDARHRAGASERRAARRSRHARVGPAADPAEAARPGVTDIVRITDARMSGTSYGTVVLHVAPEAAIGGPLAAVRNGDEVRLDITAERSTFSSPPTRSPVAASEWQPPHARLHARLRAAVPRARPAGRRGLRLRLPAGRRRAGRRSRGQVRADGPFLR